MMEGEVSRRRYRYLLIAMLAILLGVVVNANGAFAGRPDDFKADPPIQGKDQNKDALTATGTGQTVKIAHANPAVILYDQYDNDANEAIVSANRPDNPTFSAETADDFVVPGGQPWIINQVDVRGSVGFTAPESFDVIFYTNAGTLPGTAVYTANGLAFTGDRDIVIPLTTPAILPAGTYWVSVVGNMNGQNWYWEERTVLSNRPAAFRNPGNGYGTGCTNWGMMQTCTAAAGIDQMFRLNGSQGTPTPTSTGTPPTATNTATPTNTACPVANYNTAVTSGATIVPGTTDIGNHCDDCYTTVILPFAYTLYDQTFTTAQVGSNGIMILGTGSLSDLNSCLPAAGATYVILPHWDDLYTVDTAGGQGIFSSVSGVAPNRIFNLEWRAQFCCDDGPPAVNFEVRLYEGQTRFDVIYGTPMTGDGIGATSGVQHGLTPSFTQYSCDTATLTTGTMVTYTWGTGSGCPTGTPSTATSTATSTYTYTPTGTPTEIATNTANPKDTATSTATYTSTPTETPTYTSTPMDTATITPTGTATDTATNTSTPTDTATSTPTHTLTPTPTDTAISTPTVTATPTGCGTQTLNGHLTYQGMPQPNAFNVQAITLQLQPTGGGPVSTYNTNTDQNGNFTVNLGPLAGGTYTWRVKSPRYLASSGSLTIPVGCAPFSQEFGSQRAGDIDNNNCVDITDFSLLRASFGKACGDVGYNPNAEYSGDCLVDITDFGLLRSNFGQCGPSELTRPGGIKP